MIMLKNLSETELKQQAYKLGRQLKNKNLRIGLIGELGSGKTTFTKSFAKAFGIKRVKSPSFVIVTAYSAGKDRKFFHADLYRLKKFGQLSETGLLDGLGNKNGTTVIEWADKFSKLLKTCDIKVRFKINNDGTRNVKIY